MSKNPEWPKRLFYMGKTEEEHDRYIKVHPMNKFGPVTEEIHFHGGGMSESRLPPEQQMGWLLIYYMPYVAEVIHETNELVRDVLGKAHDVTEALRRLTFWRRRK